MLKALLFPVIILAVLFNQNIIIAVNIAALIGFVAYSLYFGVKKFFPHNYSIESKAT